MLNRTEGTLSGSPDNFTNQTTNEECNHESLDWTVPVIPPLIYTICALGIPLNLLVLLVFLLHKKVCTATEIYLSNMAAADLLLVMFLPFWGVRIAKGYIWTFGGSMCKIVYLVIVMNYNCSVYFLVLVSIDRFLALVHPLSHCKLRRRKYAKLSCAAVWCFGFLLNIPTLLCRQTVESNPLSYNETGCVCNFNCSLEVYFANFIVQSMVAFVIPLLIIFFCTIKILRALKERPKEGVSNQQSERKVTFLVLAVLLAFLICWLPFQVLKLVEFVVRFELIESCTLVHFVESCTPIFVNLGFFNSDLNPILYVLVGKNFRKKMWEVSSGRSSGRKSSTQFNTTTSVLLRSKPMV